MLFAMPCRHFSLSQHFAKAPQIMLWDSHSNTKQFFELPESSACCSHKKYWNKIIQEYKVDAVVVRRIGSNMLNTLFKLKVDVFSAPKGFDLDAFEVTQLTSVTHIEFARPSPKRNKSCGSGHNTACSSSGVTPQASDQRVSSNQRALANRLSPIANSPLKKVLKLTRQSEIK